MDEACNESEESKAACAGRQRKTWGAIPPEVGQAALKAYSMIIGMGGDTFGKYTVKKDVPAASNNGITGGNVQSNQPAASGPTSETKAPEAKTENREEKKEDYCRYIAMGTEVIAQFMQSTAQQEINAAPMEPQNAQTEALYRSKRNLEAKKSNTEIQVYGWGATSVCYVAMLAAGGAYQDWTMWLKGGLAVLFTVYLGFVLHDIGEQIKILDQIIAQMPKAGDCNPITQRHCYCSHPTTMNDPTHCASQIRARQVGSRTQVACIGRNQQIDPQCGCLASDSCFDVQFMSMVDGISFGGTADEAMRKPMREISRGSIPTANLGSGELAGNAVRKAKQLLAGNSGKAPGPKGPLNAGQTSEARALVDVGIPGNLAAMIASAPPGNPNLKNKLHTPGGYAGQALANFKGAQKDNILRFSGGGGNAKPGSQAQPGLDLSKLLNKGKAGAVDDKVLKFAEKAQQNAAINMQEDVNIFDIISRRYRMTGSTRLGQE
jgi:hypothetical protein